MLDHMKNRVEDGQIAPLNRAPFLEPISGHAGKDSIDIGKSRSIR